MAGVPIFNHCCRKSLASSRGCSSLVCYGNFGTCQWFIFFFAPWVSMTSPIELVQVILGRLISTTTLGIFIAYAYMRTNNVWLPVIIHFLHNTIVMFSLMNFASMEAPNGGVEYWHIIFVYVLILMVFFTPLLFSKVFRSKI